MTTQEALWRVRHRCQLLTAVALLVICPLQSAASQSRASSGNSERLRITFFDVGQADAILISAPDGSHILVDGGRDSRVVQYSLQAGVDSFALVVASHGHADHIVGLEAVFQSMPVGLFVDNGGAVPTQAFRDLQQARRQAQIPYLPARDTTFTFGALRVRVIPSPIQATGSENDRSVVIRVDYGSFSALLPGDAQVDEIQALLRQGVRPVTILKAAHHGSRNGLTPGWLATLKPKAVVISVGRGNSYGHPEPWALRYYGASRRQVFRTDTHGAVTITADTSGIFSVGTGGTTR